MLEHLAVGVLTPRTLGSSYCFPFAIETDTHTHILHTHSYSRLEQWKIHIHICVDVSELAHISFVLPALWAVWAFEQSGNSMGTFNGNAKVKFPALNYVLFLATERRSGANKTIQTGQRRNSPLANRISCHLITPFESYFGFLFFVFCFFFFLPRYSLASFSTLKPSNMWAGF